MKRAILLILILSFFNISCDSKEKKQASSISSKAPQVSEITQGIWVTVFSKEKVLYSKEAVLKLIEFCKQNKMTEIYLQVFRAGEPYYNSQILQPKEYAAMKKSMGEDPIEYLLTETHKNGLKVYAWINVLSLAQNKEAPILRKYGQLVLTRDKNLRSSIRTQDIDDSDKFYLRDDQLFLEPGDDRVVSFTQEVVSDLMNNHPRFDGLHLDYIRYPYPIPFIPDSRFLDTGISYGFGERSLDQFKQAYGLDALKDDIFPNDLYLKWDEWKRKQVTNLVGSISKTVKDKSPTWRISCAVLPGLERSYSVAYQDWPLWLDQGIVDYVILMNYTRDARWYSQSVKAALSLQKQERIYVGLGVFLFKNNEEFNMHYSLAKDLKAGGIVSFSYDEFLKFTQKSNEVPRVVPEIAANHK